MKLTKKFFAIIVAVLIAITVLSGLLVLFEGIDFVSDDFSYFQTAEAATSTSNFKDLNTNYGAFEHNSTYTFTDKAKIDRNDDKTVMRVDRTKDHGSQENPYVIYNTTQWRYFADQMFSSATCNHGEGSFFALGADLTFNTTSKITYNSTNTEMTGTGDAILCFKGTFYGLGHTINNFTINADWNDTRAAAGRKDGGMALGLFCWFENDAVVTDLILNNFDYYNVPFCTGGIIGMCWASSTLQSQQMYILNCYVKGKIRRDNQASSGKVTHAYCGGIAGAVHTDNWARYYNTNATFYRCSSDAYIYIISSGACAAGGILGGSLLGANTAILNCFARLVAHTKERGDSTNSDANSSNCHYLYSGSAVGVEGGCNKLYINNFAGQAYYPENGSEGTILKGYEASLFGMWGSWKMGEGTTPLNAIPPNAIEVRNAYACADYSGKKSDTDSSVLTTWLFPWSMNRWASWHMVDQAYTNVTVQNVHYSGLTTTQRYPGDVAVGLHKLGFAQFDSLVDSTHKYGQSDAAADKYYYNCVDTAANPQVKQETNVSALQTEARNGLRSNSAWDTDKLTLSASYTSVSGLSAFSVNTSPVYSPIATTKFKINYKNYYSDGSEATDARTADEYSPLDTTINFASATKQGRVFKGWTFDVDDSSNPLTSISTASPCRFNGDLTVYAIWQITKGDETASISNNIEDIGGTKLSDGTLKFQYDGATALELTANISDVDSSYRIDYRWQKDNVDFATTKSAYIRNVSDKGNYTLSYKLSSTKEPLALPSAWISAGSQNVSISNMTASYTPNSLVLNKTAYVGMPFSDLNGFRATMTDAAGNAVSGTFAWSTEGGNTIDPEHVVEGAVAGTYTYRKKFVFTPTGAAASNYDPCEVEVDIPVEYLLFRFNISGVVKPMEINAVYGENYSYANIAKLFEDELLKRVDDNDPNYTSVVDKQPWLDSKPIDQYRGQQGTVTMTATKTISVDLKDLDYTVTFKMAFADDRQETYKYGQTLKDTSEWVNQLLPAGYILVGWNFQTKNDLDQTVTRAWNMDTDRVKQNVELTAETLQLTYTGVESFEVYPLKTIYNALETVKPADLRVEIVFTTNHPDHPTYTRILSGSEYTIAYQRGNALHVDAPSITLTYMYGSEPKTCSQSFTVNKLNVDISGVVNFVDSSDFYEEGAPRTLPTVDQPYPRGVGSVNYEYYDIDDNTITPAQITGSKTAEVTYIIKAIFVPSSEDYKGTEKSITFTVFPEPVSVHLVWESSSLPYNGETQYPKAKVVRDDNGNEVTVTLDYSGDINVRDVNSGAKYRVEASISNKAFKLTGDNFCEFDITVAELKTPRLPRDLSYIGADIDLRDILLDFDPDVLNIAGDYIVRNAKDNYSVVFTRKDSVNYRFESGNASETLTFSVAKAPLTVRWDNTSFVYDGNAYGPRVIGFIELLGTDVIEDFDTQIIYTDERESAELGSHTIGMMFASNVSFRANYTLSGNTVTYTVLPGDGNYMVVKVVWSEIPANGYVYNGEIQHPTFTVLDENDNDITSSVTVAVSGGYDTSKYAKIYNCTVQITGSGDTLYVISEGDTVTFEIKLDEQGNGAEPVTPTPGGDTIDPNPTPGNDGSVLDKIKDFFVNLIEQNFPLWQVCTMAVGGLLTLIFLLKTLQYSNRRKKAKGEAKKLSARTFALAPIFSTEVMFAGLTNQIWSIIAFSVAGLCLLMFVTMLITRKSWKKAELAKEAAAEDLEKRKFESQNASQLALQEKISQVGDSGNLAEILRQRDEEHRREMEELREEQAKRDEAMKLMLANLMGRSQGVDSEPIYGSIDDTDLLVQKVIAGLLPAVQQMIPDTTAYLTAPGYEESEGLKALVEEQKALVEEQKAIVEEQSDQIRNMSEQMAFMQEQLASMTQERVEGILLPDESEEIKELNAKIAELQEQLAAASTDEDDNSEEIKALTAEMAELKNQLADATKSKSEPVVVNADQSEEIKALTAEVLAMRKEMANMSEQQSVLPDFEYDDDDFDDEEEWDSILDEEEDDFVEAVVVEADGTVRKSTPNFRMRLKQSSDKNKEWYTVIKNMFCSQKGVTYRVCKRVEKIRYQGQVIGVIGIAKRSIKLWLALKPYEYDARRYHHKDVSDKPRFIDVPMYVRVGSDRGLVRAQELILALFQELNMEERKRYNDRSIQELIFTLKHNRLLANKQTKQLLCEVMHVHDCDDVLDDETAEKCVEYKNVDYIDDSLIATVKLDDIDAYFQDGNRVTLEKLKKAGLISEECTGYNVVADKRLTKPLIIVANDFSITAIKLIALTGGRAIKLQTV